MKTQYLCIWIFLCILHSSFSQVPLPYKIGVAIGGVETDPVPRSECDGHYRPGHIVNNKLCSPNTLWHLVFEDEFGGTQLDRSKWKSYAVCAGDVHNTENNLAFTGGTMKMQFKQQNGTAYCYDGTSKNFDFTSGGIQTHTKFRHGFYEIRCKLPGGIGVNPSFWLYGDCSQEVDVFELLEKGGSHHSTVYSNIHRDYGCNGNDKCEQGYYTGLLSVAGDNLYHTFGFEWDDYHIAIFIDGIRTRVVYWGYKEKKQGAHYNCVTIPHVGQKCWFKFGKYKNPVYSCSHLNIGSEYWVYEGFPTHAMCVILTLQKLQDAASNNYQEFEIDYVRIWQKINCDEEIKICDFNNYSLSHDHYTTYTHHDPVIAKKITFECGTSGSCNYQMDLDYYHESSRSYYATDMIDILPGFDTGLAPGYGGYDAISHRFDAGIRPCPLAVQGKTDEEEYYADNEDTENMPETETEEMQETYQQTLTDNSLNDLLVYPNPSTSEVHIHIPNTYNNPFTLTLTDTQMKTVKVLETGTVQSQHIYNLQDLPAGMYFVQFSSPSHKITKKLIKLW